MNNLISIDSSWARNNFFDILSSVYLGNKGYLIKKSGIPVAKIVRPAEGTEKEIMEFAGIWKDLATGKLLKLVASGRKDKGRLKRKLPHVFN